MSRDSAHAATLLCTLFVLSLTGNSSLVVSATRPHPVSICRLIPPSKIVEDKTPESLTRNLNDEESSFEDVPSDQAGPEVATEVSLSEDHHASDDVGTPSSGLYFHHAVVQNEIFYAKYHIRSQIK